VEIIPDKKVGSKNVRLTWLQLGGGGGDGGFCKCFPTTKAATLEQAKYKQPHVGEAEQILDRLWPLWHWN
jgi:hypothetical protein